MTMDRIARHGRRVIVALALLGATVAHCEPTISVSLAFSTDGGKSYSGDFPIVGSNAVVFVKASWQIEGEGRPVKAGITTSYLLNSERDFGSAVTGLQRWGGKKAWYQRLKKYWFSFERERSCVYRLDLGARPEGRIGVINAWDKEKGRHVNGPLPASPAVPTGTHRFTVRVGYNLKATNEGIEKRTDFLVTVREGVVAENVPASKVAVAPVPPAAKRPATKPVPLPLPVLAGDVILSVDTCRVLAGDETIRRSGSFIVPSSKQEVAWTVPEIEAGSYYLRAFVETGTLKSSESGLGRAPFLYVNGRAIEFLRCTTPVPREKHCFGIIETARPLALRQGDEIRWNTLRGYGGKQVGGIALARERLACAPLRISYGHDPYYDDMIRLTGAFKPLAAAADELEFAFQFESAKPQADTFAVSVRVFDYFQRCVGEREESVSVAPRETFARTVPVARGDSDRYRAVVAVSAADGTSREVVGEILVDNLTAFRRKLWLNRGWGWVTLADATEVGVPTDVPEDAKWRRVNLPASWQDIPNGPVHKHHVAWYRKRLTLPEAFPAEGERGILHVSRASFTCKVFINGREAGTHWGPTGPFDFDVTDLLRSGKENELLIGLCDGSATRDYGEDGRVRDGRLLAPRCTKAGLGEIYVHTVGTSAIQDVFVKTSLKRKMVTVDVEVPDLPPGKRHEMRNTVYYQGKPVLELPVAYLEGGPGRRVSVERRWRKPILWGPVEFPLLQLVTELWSAGGDLRDRVETRFGFREFSTEGRSLAWNGEQVKFSARPFLSSWGWQLTRRNKRAEIRATIRAATRMGCRMHRHIYDPEHRADIMDEEGVVFAQGRGGLSGPNSEKVNSDTFWENTALFTREMIRGLRNHPSIVTWYLSNEFYGETYDRNSERLRQLGEEALQDDDTRLIEFGCDLDLRGYTKHISTHYPVDGNALRQAEAYFPEAAYWHRFDQPLKSGMKAPAGMAKRVANVLAESPITWGRKPIVVNETCWNLFFSPPDAMTKLVGDAVYADSRWADLTHDAANTWFCRGHRDAEVSAITLWKWVTGNPNWISVPRADINILQQYNAFYSGTDVTYDVNLHFDEFRAATLTFEWALRRRDGEIVARDRDRMRFGSCDLKRTRIAFEAPKVSGNVAFVLVVTLCEGGTELRRVELPISVHPTPDLPLSPRLRIGICDPSGNSVEGLRRLIPSACITAEPSVETLRELDVLIIGEAVPEGALTGRADAIAEFAEQGGRVLVLPQEFAPDFLPVSVQLSPRVAAINFTHRSSHPVVAGLASRDLRYWYPHHRVAERCISKPQSGNFRVIIEAGGPKGMLYGGLVEWDVGKGLVICSQLSWLEMLDSAPAALTLWKALFGYLVASVDVPDRAAYFGAEAGSLRTALAHLGTALDAQSGIADLNAYKTAIVDTAVAMPVSTADGLRDFAERGGTVLLRNVNPDTVALATRVCGTPVHCSSAGADSWRGRAICVGTSSLTEGLTNYDLFWKKRPESENYRPCYSSAKEALAVLGDWAVWSESGEPLTYPSYLVRVPVGKGSVLIDNLNWDKPKAGITTHCDRIASTLLTNLGVRLKGRTSIRLPTNLNYETVDIAGVLNRALRDEVDDDGQGGWSDQGEKLDLRDFPTDKPEQVFDGVPFRVAQPNACLVLASKYRDSTSLPEQVDIPVERKADVLFFLQSSAWTSAKHHANYVVHYQDGTDYTIKLIGGVNYRDWVASAPDEPFLYETDTVTRRAWSGKSILFPKVSLYSMGWVNPKPEKSIASVTFESKGLGVPILVALTAGRKAEALSDERAISSPEAVKEAEHLVKDGLELVARGASEQAESRFRKAILTAPDRWDGYLQLGYLREKEGKWGEAIGIYEDLLKQIPNQLEAYIRIGVCYEKLKRWGRAIETYRRSLTVNPNQPPVIQALEAAKKRAGE
ncbi:MAG: tetratricopeptide repeat protein [Lentisphaerae bacterium]|jgi:hypothetical protein|nr:tetratricopeptide repeat protein [Lentisphaerota bacterium]MBT5609205.1 tetratricopeptide repeat protein [Lentisphaerota bacterium]MBT7847149.1 tetratricopeptide repeat protein [Lentisphaerota bacterium]